MNDNIPALLKGLVPDSALDQTMDGAAPQRRPPVTKEETAQRAAVAAASTLLHQPRAQLAGGGTLQFQRRTLKQLGDMICGNFEVEKSFFRYRSSSRLTEFFEDVDTDYVHDGTTRVYWVADTLENVLAEPQPAANVPPDTFARVIRRLMDPDDAMNEGPDRPGAFVRLNATLKREGFEAFYGDDGQCYL